MRYLKDPSAKLDYSISFDKWLPEGDLIASAVWTVEAGLTLSASPAPSFTPTVATVWLEGGAANTDYTVACRITTMVGRIEERSIVIAVRDR